MSVLWFLPVVAVAIGMIAVAAVARHAASAVADLRATTDGLSELGEQVAALQEDARTVRRSFDDVRGRRTLPVATDRSPAPR
jgi:paraquat-inducible protein B